MKQPLYFVESIWFGDKRYFFSFRQILVMTGLKFCIVTLDHDHLVVFEITTDKYSKLRIVPPVPDWIKSIEQRLIQIIEARIVE